MQHRSWVSQGGYKIIRARYANNMTQMERKYKSMCIFFFMLRELIRTTSSYFLCSSRYMTEMASLFSTVNSVSI